MLCSVVGKWSVSCHPDYPSNLIHVLEEGMTFTWVQWEEQTWPPVSEFFVVRFPPSGETAKKNVKQVVNLSCPQSFFADAESIMETVTI